MHAAEEIAVHIPFLRRYARILTGSQKSGDTYVTSLLQAMVEQKVQIDEQFSARVDVYKAFTDFWQPLNQGVISDAGIPSDEDANVDRRIEQLAPAPRQAFLLTSVEEFTEEEACAILGVSEDELAKLLDKAGEEIARQVATEILIIEDEPIISIELENLVRSLGHGVVGTARTHSEALQVIETRKPGLVLADIQLADGSSGIDAVNDILHKINLPVIFITAYPERLLTGDRPEPAFLITKPFRENSVKAVISQALFFDVKAGEPLSVAS